MLRWVAQARPVAALSPPCCLSSAALLLLCCLSSAALLLLFCHSSAALLLLSLPLCCHSVAASRPAQALAVVPAPAVRPAGRGRRGLGLQLACVGLQTP